MTEKNVDFSTVETDTARRPIKYAIMTVRQCQRNNIKETEGK